MTNGHAVYYQGDLGELSVRKDRRSKRSDSWWLCNYEAYCGEFELFRADSLEEAITWLEEAMPLCDKQMTEGEETS